MCACVRACALAALLATGQVPTAAQPAAGDKPRITLDVTRVSLLATVTDRRGRLVGGLKADDFEVLENKRPQRILEFSAAASLPLRLALLLDASTSVREQFRFIQEASIQFLRYALRDPQDLAMVISFDSVMEPVSDFSNDQASLAKAIRELRAGRGTALYDAIDFACREKLSRVPRNLHFRKVVVIVSDGEDTQSRMTRTQALEAAIKGDVVIYAISSNSNPAETEGDRVLRFLASETGGFVVFPFKRSDLAQSFDRIANELRRQYAILYRPEPLPTDGRYHTVEVRVKGKKNLSVRSRKGYFAPLSP